MRVKDWSTPRVTIHRHLEICHLGMQFVHNWLRKRTYALCKSCRGMLDLQLSYSNFCALQFKFLEKNPGQSRQAELVLTLGAPERRPRRRSRPGPLGPHTKVGLGPSVSAPWDPLASHRLPPPLPGRHARRGHAVPTLRRPPTRDVTVPPHVVAVPVPMLLLGLHVGEREPPCKRRRL
jgi:hypothetical protein